MRRPSGPSQPALGLILACSALLGAGCAGVSITKQRHGPDPVALASYQAPAPLDGRNLLDPDALIARSHSEHRAGVLALEGSCDEAARHQVDALVSALNALGSLRTDLNGKADAARTVAALGASNAALREVIRLTSGRRIRVNQAWTDRMAALGVQVTLGRETNLWPADELDEYLFADDYAIQGIDNQYHTDGLGVPLVGLRKFSLKDLDGREGEEKFLMPRQVYPVTAVAVMEPDSGDGRLALRLELHDPLKSMKMTYAGRPLTVASDLTTPLVYHFARSPLPILQEIGLLDPQWLEKLSGLYMLHPYEPGKIPVLFVHGLRSSPAAWMKVLNDLRGDPTLRDRYQFWLFMYPTGSPFPDSAGRLRIALNEIRGVIDPGRADPALDRMVLVGHSMGGLVSKMLITTSGDEIWKLVGRRPFEELRATPERKEHLRNVFFFEPHPSVERMVFIATPHRGSELGDQFIGRLTDRLIRLPGSLRSTYRALLMQNGRDFFTSEILRDGVPSSIDELRPDNPLLKALNALPVKPGLVAHSIMGREVPSVPILESSDGVVPYHSSHIDWAASEKVVEGDHGCQDTPETIRELSRILYLHIGKRPPTLDNLPKGPTMDSEKAFRPFVSGSDAF